MAQKPRRPLLLSETQHGSFGADYEDLRWYFQESKAAESGLKSSQAALEAQLESPTDRSGRTPHPLPRTAPIQRARRIRSSLSYCTPQTQFRLREFFRVDFARLYAPVGSIAGLFPSSPPVWAAYRQGRAPGGFSDFVRALAAAYGQKDRQAKRIVSAARRDCEARFAEALAEYRAKAETRRRAA